MITEAELRAIQKFIYICKPASGDGRPLREILQNEAIKQEKMMLQEAHDAIKARKEMKKIFLLTLAVGLWTLDGYAEDHVTQNVARTVNVFFRDATTGQGKTGLTVTGITCDLAKSSTTLSATKTTFTCAASGSSNDCVEIAHGLYNVELSAANLDTRGPARLVCQCAGALDTKVEFQVDSAASVAFNQDGNITDGPTIAANVLDITVGSHNTAGTLGGLLNTNLDLPVSTVNTTAAAVPTTLLDLPNGIETSFTVRQALRLILSAQAGKLSGVDTNTPTFRDVNDTKNRIISTTNSTGRTAVTLDPN